MNMISLNVKGYDAANSRDTIDSILVSIFNIKTITDSNLGTNEKSEIKFIDDSHIYVIESKEKILELFNS